MCGGVKDSLVCDVILTSSSLEGTRKEAQRGGSTCPESHSQWGQATVFSTLPALGPGASWQGGPGGHTGWEDPPCLTGGQCPSLWNTAAGQRNQVRLSAPHGDSCRPVSVYRAHPVSPISSHDSASIAYLHHRNPGQQLLLHPLCFPSCTLLPLPC